MVYGEGQRSDYIEDLEKEGKIILVGKIVAGKWCYHNLCDTCTGLLMSVQPQQLHTEITFS